MLHVVRLRAAIIAGRYRRAVVKIAAINPSASDESINGGSLYDSTIRLPRSDGTITATDATLIAYLSRLDFLTPSSTKESVRERNCI